MIKLMLHREDFVQELGVFRTQQIFGEVAAEAVLGAGDGSEFFDELPRVVVGKLKKMIPQDFRLSEIKVEFQVEGDIKVARASGTVTATFTSSK